MSLYGPNRRPKYRKNYQFGEAMGRLTRAHETFDAKQSKSRCRFPLSVGKHCDEIAVAGHTIQNAILQRISTNGHVMTFSRSIASIRRRLVEHETEESKAMYDQCRWSPEKRGVNEASIYYFSCNSHDTELFKLIEHTEGPMDAHPLDGPLTAAHHSMLMYRIALLKTEQLARTLLMIESMKKQDQRSPAVLLRRGQIKATQNVVVKDVKLFEERYLTQNFESFVDIPVDMIIDLPTGIALADTWSVGVEHRNDAGVFLFILPLQQLQHNESGQHRHRMIISRMRQYQPSTERTVQEITRLVNNIGEGEGFSEFLMAILTNCQNTFFSHDYKELPEKTLMAIEGSVYEAMRLMLGEPLQRYM